MKTCIVCEAAAHVYCANDDAFLCNTCDEHVHSANMLAQKHRRVKVCELCCSSASTVYCKTGCCAHLCADCDVSSHMGIVMSRHHRVPVSGKDEGLCDHSDGANSSNLGNAHSHLCQDVTEEDSMFAVPDVPLVPPGVEDFPEWNSISGPLDAKALLGKEFENDLDIFDMDPTWLDRLDMGFDDLTQSMLDGVVPEFNDAFIMDAQKEPMAPVMMDVPSQEPVTGSPISSTASLPPLGDHCERKPTFPSHSVTRIMQPQMMASPGLEWTPYGDAQPLDIASFVPPSMRPVDAKTLLERAVDRKARLARYREKKKNRQFKKTIRYASRKAYAEVRPRVKGRFARKDEVAAMRAAGTLPAL